MATLPCTTGLNFQTADGTIIRKPTDLAYETCPEGTVNRSQDLYEVG